jgi:hypothetical protein
MFVLINQVLVSSVTRVECDGLKIEKLNGLKIKLCKVGA